MKSNFCYPIVQIYGPADHGLVIPTVESPRKQILVFDKPRRICKMIRGQLRIKRMPYQESNFKYIFE